MEFPNFLETEYLVLCYEKPAINIYCKKLETSLQGVEFQKTVGLIFMRDLRFWRNCEAYCLLWGDTSTLVGYIN